MTPTDPSKPDDTPNNWTKTLAEDEWVHVTPGTVSGQPRVAGHRIMVWIILQAIETTESIEGVKEWYPHITTEQIKGVLRWCRKLTDLGDDDPR